MKIFFPLHEWKTLFCFIKYGRDLLLFKPITSFLFIFTTVLYETIEHNRHILSFFKTNFKIKKKGTQTTQRNHYVANTQPISIANLIWVSVMSFPLLESNSLWISIIKRMYFQNILVHVHPTSAIFKVRVVKQLISWWRSLMPTIAGNGVFSYMWRIRFGNETNQ